MTSTNNLLFPIYMHLNWGFFFYGDSERIVRGDIVLRGDFVLVILAWGFCQGGYPKKCMLFHCVHSASHINANTREGVHCVHGASHIDANTREGVHCVTGKSKKTQKEIGRAKNNTVIMAVHKGSLSFHQHLQRPSSRRRRCPSRCLGAGHVSPHLLHFLENILDVQSSMSYVLSMPEATCLSSSLRMRATFCT